MTTTKQYDLLNRLTSISSSGSQLSTPISFNYIYNDANQRIQCRLADGSFWVYQYDSLGQVKSGKKYWPDWTPVAGQQFEYGFDDIGNRSSTKAGGDSSGQGLRSANYSANNLNQYSSRDTPGAFDVLGVALASETVTVNTASVYRHGEYYRKEVTAANTSVPVWQSVAVAATGETTVNCNVFVPKTAEQFTYDLDGNLLTDGRWNYTWDAENRLLKMAANTSVGPQNSLQFEYDSRSRRIRKQVWSNTTWSGSSTNDVRFLYDGWNLLATLNPQLSTLNSFLWGSDLSGSPQGAGGIGGLLAVNDANLGTHFAAFDGNGNIGGLIKAGDGTGSAQYEYSPFGELLRATGPLAKLNPTRFSTKYQDDETDFLYYGRRYYNPNTGRWISRDPIEEKGGLDLYGFAFNSPQRFIDILGLSGVAGPPAGLFSWIAQFDPLHLDWGQFASAYTALTGEPIVDINEFNSTLSTALYLLAGSYNPTPTDPFDPLTRETRGWLKLVVTVDCCAGKVANYRTTTIADDGWTPFRPAPGHDRADGNAQNLKPNCYVNGDRVYCDVTHRSRIGSLGRRLFKNWFPGVGVPFNWRRIEYVLRCDGSYRSDYSGSFFPSHRAYLGKKGVATWDQSGLAGFMFAGDAVDAPGGNFHFEEGTVQAKP